MKTRQLFYSALIFLCSMTSLYAQGPFIAIPDANFRSYLEVHYPSSMQDGNLYYTTVAVAQTTLLDLSYNNIADLTGIEYFSGLKSLYSDHNQLTQFPNLPPALQELIVDYNQLTVLPSAYPAGLTSFSLTYNQFTTIAGLPDGLTYVDCSHNPISSLSLPSTLQTLICNNSGLTSLPALPSNMYALKVDTNQLNSLPALPAGLHMLSANHNQLLSLPAVPASLRGLNVGYNQLSTLPVLPEKLNRLYCPHNAITTLGSDLPDSLTYLDCSYNAISPTIPALPERLIVLGCEYNQLTSLPPLHDLLTLACSYNQITLLPSLEGLSIRNLYCDNNQILCLPYLPASMSTLMVGGNLFSCIPNLPTGLTDTPDITQLCDQTDPTADCAYPRINGKVFIDANTNGIQDGGELGLPYAKLEIQPDNIIVLADVDGNYSVPVDTRDYTIRVYSEDYPHYSFSPATQSASFTAYGQTDSGNNFAASFSEVVNDLEITITPLSRIRASRVTGYTITYANRGTVALSGTVSLVYETDLTLHLANPVASSHTGQTMDWTFTSLYPGETKNINVYFVPPSTVPVNTVYTYTATISPVSGDATIDNNQSILNHTVTGALDPNFKEVAPAGDIAPEDVPLQDPFTYVVHFQNTGNDLAFVVTIKDTISTNFEIQGIQTISASHPYTFRMSEGAALWTFDDIQLPDSTSDERNSHGFVKYRIIPKNTLQLNDEIKNTAHIFFDYNDPVKTNTTLNRVASVTALHETSNDHLLELYPNPSNGSFYLDCKLKETGTIKVMSSEGKVIYTQDSADLSLPQAIELNTGKGIYIVQVIAGQKTMTRKLVVSR
ncbi:MAG: hypothetical protein JWM14_2474 [Chitinophagaceae bacterium]|nr:hypothetical protein [Chitinophagaceae bacterium]